MANSTYCIPFALDLSTGELVSPDRAIRNPPRGRYQCPHPTCHGDVTTASSKHGRRHFRHFRGVLAHEEQVSGKKKSQTIHDRAQFLLHERFTDALAKRRPMPCLEFETPTGIHKVQMFIPGKTVVTEWTCPLTSRRADLAILDYEGEPLLLIEVFHFHAVDKNKRADLSVYWWIEVVANEVIEDTARLKIKAFGNLPDEFRLMGEQGELFAGVA